MTLCAIVSIVTCCFSVNLATSDYKKSTAKIYEFHHKMKSGEIKLQSNTKFQEVQNRTVSHSKAL